MTNPILSVRNVVIEVATAAGVVRLVDGVSFDVMPHEVFGIVGESGSGKSLTMLAVMGLLPPPLRLVAGEVMFAGQDIARLDFQAMRSIRGRRMAMIFQDPMTSLNPVKRIGWQIGEAIRLHRRSVSEAQIRDEVIALLELVGINDAPRRYRQFPNEFSGGMRQRAMIAMAIVNEPDLLIADEPTTALDVTIQAQVMDVLAKVRSRNGAAMVLITHDLGLVAETADRVGVMYGGRMMERAPVNEAFLHTAHPYTTGLLASLPRLDDTARELYSIPGHVPDLAARPSGCVFHPRCGMRRDRPDCSQSVPAFRELGRDHRAACHFAEETPDWARHAALTRQPGAATNEPARRTPGPPVLALESLGKDFRVRRSAGWGHDTLQAVTDISFNLAQGETLGLVGESGCGKSTLGRVILGLYPATRGAIRLTGETIDRKRLRRRRRDMQVVFQDPYASLDPRMTVGEIIAEPLRINKCYRPERIVELLSQVGLPRDAALRRPPQFSGGQRQRIAIARALALEPKLLVLDEAVSALDVSIQAQVINLLKQLQQDFGLSYLFISHDLSVVRHISDRVAVMYLGRLIETGTRDQVFEQPSHPYTQALLSAIPVPDPSARGQGRLVLAGELPNPLSPPSGCAFRTRCFKVQQICVTQAPALSERTGVGHHTACHFAEPLQPHAAPALDPSLSRSVSG